MLTIVQKLTGVGSVSGGSVRKLLVMRCSKDDANPVRGVKGVPPSRFHS